MSEGCIEKISFDFFKWVWQYPKTKKPLILKKMEQLSKDKEIIILKSQREVQLFLNKVQQNQ
jgi:hypothetical protein